MLCHRNYRFATSKKLFCFDKFYHSSFSLIFPFQYVSFSLFSNFILYCFSLCTGAPKYQLSFVLCVPQLIGVSKAISYLLMFNTYEEAVEVRYLYLIYPVLCAKIGQIYFKSKYKCRKLFSFS